MNVTGYQRALRLARAALQAAGHKREPSEAELLLAEAWCREGATIDLVERVVRHMRGQIKLDLLDRGEEVTATLRSRRKSRGAA